MTHFSLQVKDWVERTKGKGDKFLQQFSSEIAAQVIKGTPVKTGFARASWYPAINDENAEAAAGKNSLGTLSVMLNRVKAGDRIFILNNAKYIKRLEYGHSNQAPNGMVRITLAKAQQISDEIIARLQR